MNLDWNNWTPKPGDLVVCLKSEQGYKTQDFAFIKGHVYKVRGFRNDNKYRGACTVLIERDSLGSEENGWCLQFFRPASKAAEVLYTTKE